MSYKAFVGKIHVFPHPNADRLQLGTISGEQVIVGLETKEDDLMVLFSTDGQLSLVFAEANNLIAKKDPETGEKIGGYFEPSCRVKAQKFRGARSEGFTCSLNYLLKAGVSEETVGNLKEGDEFDTLDGIEICRKYITPATAKSLRGGTKKKKPRRKIHDFAEHVDTMHLPRHERHMIYPGLVHFTEKLHGTSARYGYVKVEEDLPQNWLQKFFRRPVKRGTSYKYISGSRRAIVGENDTNQGWYKTNEFRLDFMERVWPLLRKGEIIYGEIVGWATGAVPIMPPAPIKELPKEKRSADYPKSIMHYSYGCEPGQHKFFVYRITNVNQEGIVSELPWLRVKARCKELGLQHVPDLLPGVFISTEEERDTAVKTAESVYEGVSTLDKRHIREGTVVRVESGIDTQFFKYKSFDFKVLEGIIKSDVAYVDLEEAEG